MKKEYIKPIIDVLDAKVEKGFAGSASNDLEQNNGIEPLLYGTDYMFN